MQAVARVTLKHTGSNDCDPARGPFKRTQIHLKLSLNSLVLSGPDLAVREQNQTMIPVIMIMISQEEGREDPTSLSLHADGANCYA